MCMMMSKYSFDKVNKSALNTRELSVSPIFCNSLNQDSQTNKKFIINFSFKLMSKVIFVLLFALFFISSISQQTCPYGQYVQFTQKELDHPFNIISNPYDHPSEDYLSKVKENLSNKQRVCALKYFDEQKKTYGLKTFDNKILAQSEGYIVTHQGVCGKCSTTKDLYVYLTTDLTRPVRKCGLKYFYSHKKMKQCIKNLGFTDACTQVWYWNTLNTKKHCLKECLWAYLSSQQFVIDGELNSCLQCDEDISGPIFKYESGRTRRNSGIHSEIDRPQDQIYKIAHCYY